MFLGYVPPVWLIHLIQNWEKKTNNSNLFIFIHLKIMFSLFNQLSELLALIHGYLWWYWWIILYYSHSIKFICFVMCWAVKIIRYDAQSFKNFLVHLLRPTPLQRWGICCVCFGLLHKYWVHPWPDSCALALRCPAMIWINFCSHRIADSYDLDLWCDDFSRETVLISSFIRLRKVPIS